MTGEMSFPCGCKNMKNALFEENRVNFKNGLSKIVFNEAIYGPGMT